eukprot:gene22130-30366_t
MSFPEPFPEDILSEIREYPGNQKCCDCGSLDTDWGSVSHGTLICLDCAGKHRSLGVHVSFVRSIRMDSWSRQQVEMMRQGGNQQIRRFFQKIEIENSPILTLYCTKGASHYRERLRERVEKIMSGEIKSEKRIVHNSAKEPAILTLTSLKSSIPNGIHTPSNISMSTRIENFRIMFADGPMGMTLTKDSKEMALVSKLIPGGAAQSNGVKIGDHIIGVAGKSLDNYDEIMHMIPCMNRPLEIQFSRIISISTSSKSLAVDTRLAKVHESKSDSNLVVSATLSPKPLASPISIGVPRVSTNDGIANRYSNNNHRHPSATTSKTISNEIYVQKAHNSKLTTAQSLNNAQANPASSAPIPVNNALSIDQPPREVLSWSPGTNRSMSPLAGTFEVSPVSSPERIIATRPASRTDANNLTMESTSKKQLHGIVRFEEKVGEDFTEIMEARSAESDATTEKAAGLVLEAGAIVKVIRDGRWRSCVIRRTHKDGTFKVCFRDGTTESRVPISRMALSKSALSFAAASERNSVDTLEENKYANPQRSLYGIQEVEGDNMSFDFDPADFVVNSSLDIESWIEQEDECSRGMLTGGSLKSKSHDPRDESARFHPSLRSISYDSKSFAQAIAADNGAYTSLDDKGDITWAANGAGNEAIDVEVIFDEPPLGLTLSMGTDGEPEVTKTVMNGAAMRMGVQVGDMLIKVADSLVSDYDEVMEILPFCSYPLALIFRRGKNKKESLFSGEAVLRSSTLIATKLMDTIGLTKPPTSLLTAPTVTRLSNSKRNNTFDGSLYLSNSVTSDKEFDVTFDDVELGFRIDERIGVETVSVVTQVLPSSPAMEKGVRVGCILVGINYEKFISHAHSVATLKYVKRPVTVRFRRDTK